MHTWVNLSLAFTAFVDYSDEDNDATLTILYPAELERMVMLSFADCQLVMGIEDDHKDLLVFEVSKDDYQRSGSTYFFGVRILESHDMYDYAMKFFNLGNKSIKHKEIRYSV